MDPELLETSLALVDSPDDTLDARFYALLFERRPDARPLFGEDRAARAKLLRSAVISVADHLDDPVWLTETLAGPDTGGPPSPPGLPMDDAVTSCMVAAMAEIGGSRWTPEMTDAWLEALDAVSGLVLPCHGLGEQSR